jgi:hypothetical protein
MDVHPPEEVRATKISIASVATALGRGVSTDRRKRRRRRTAGRSELNDFVTCLLQHGDSLENGTLAGGRGSTESVYVEHSSV